MSDAWWNQPRPCRDLFPAPQFERLPIVRQLACCAACQVRAECLDDAVETCHRWWAGWLPSERGTTVGIACRGGKTPEQIRALTIARHPTNRGRPRG